MAATDELTAALQYGPRTAGSIRRSQYLDQAIQALSQGAQAPKSWGETGTKLIANALLIHQREKSDAGLLAALKADQGDQAAPGLSWLDSSTQQPSAPPTPQVAAPTPAPPAPQAASPEMAPIPQPASGSSWITPSVIKAVAGEAEGEGPDGMKAVMGVILNRARHSGMTPDQVVSAPHQFEGLHSPRVAGLTPDSPRYQSIVQALTGAQPGPYDHFYSPGGQTALGRQPPSWDNGHGVDIGRHRFFSLDGQTPAPPSPPDPQQFPQAYSPPSSAASPPAAQGTGGAPASVQAAPPTPSPQGQPPSLQGPTPTPAEAAMVRQLLANPRTFQQGQALLMKLQQRAAAPDEFEVKIDPTTGQSYWASKTRPGVQMAANMEGARGALPGGLQYGPDGRASAIPGTEMGAPQGVPGTVGTFQRGPNGAMTKIGEPGVQGGPYRIPGAPGLYMTGPSGAPQKVADDEYGPTQLQALREGLIKSEPYSQYNEARAALTAMIGASAKPGGIPDYAMLDTFARAINPGAVARVGTIQAIRESRGIPDSLKGALLQFDPNKPGQQLTPQVRQMILDTTRDFVASRRSNLDVLLKSNDEFARRHGVNPQDITADPGPVPERFVLPELRQQPGGQAPVQGARKAPDGHWYVPDPQRPGKFLRVDG